MAVSMQQNCAPPMMQMPMQQTPMQMPMTKQQHPPLQQVKIRFVPTYSKEEISRTPLMAEVAVMVTAGSY